MSPIFCQTAMPQRLPLGYAVTRVSRSSRAIERVFMLMASVRERLMLLRSHCRLRGLSDWLLETARAQQIG